VSVYRLRKFLHAARAATTGTLLTPRLTKIVWLLLLLLRIVLASELSAAPSTSLLMTPMAVPNPDGLVKAIPLVFVSTRSECAATGRDIVLDLRRFGLRLSASPFVPPFDEPKPEWSEQVMQDHLQSRAQEIFRTRTRAVLFFRADPDLPFGEVVRVLGIVRPAVDYIVLIMPSDKFSSCFVKDPPFPPAQRGTLLREK